MNESVLVDDIISQLRATDKWAVNVHGGAMRTDGVSDVISQDKNNILTLIEVKVGNNKPSRNQWNQGIEAIRKGNRFIIAYEDFNIFAFDNDEIPFFVLNESVDSFEVSKMFKENRTVEVIFEKGVD